MPIPSPLLPIHIPHFYTPRSVGVQLSKENRENRWISICPRKLTRILPACPSSPSPAPCPVLAPSPPPPTKSSPPLPHLYFLPPHSTLFQTSGFKPPAQQQQPTLRGVVWRRRTPPHSSHYWRASRRASGTGGGHSKGGRLPPSTSVYQLASPMTPHTHPHQVPWLPRDTKTTNVENHLRITKTRLDTLR